MKHKSGNGLRYLSNSDKPGEQVEGGRSHRVLYAAHFFRNYAFRVIACALLLLSFSGCANPMPSSSQATHEVNGNLFPLRFKVHSFSAFAFNTLRCKVIYDNFDFTPEVADKPSGPPSSNDYREHWGFGSFIGIRNFPGPIEVSWTALDGSNHHASVDLASIFPDEQVLHRVPEEEIPEGLYPQGLYLDPGIFLEVNDRTINVYMRALIATKQLQIPGNKYSNGRDDLILAWTHTY